MFKSKIQINFLIMLKFTQPKMLPNVCCHTDTFVSTFLSPQVNLNMGRLLAHEVGHALGANHDDGEGVVMMMVMVVRT